MMGSSFHIQEQAPRLSAVEQAVSKWERANKGSLTSEGQSDAVVTAYGIVPFDVRAKIDALLTEGLAKAQETARRQMMARLSEPQP